LSAEYLHSLVFGYFGLFEAFNFHWSTRPLVRSAVFVPEGQHDSSQARSAWNHEENSPVPAGRLKPFNLGMILRTPLVPSASPLSGSLDNIKRMEDAGADVTMLDLRGQKAVDRMAEMYLVAHGFFPKSVLARILEWLRGRMTLAALLRRGRPPLGFHPHRSDRRISLILFA
jgi:hypothetical protein